MERTRQAEAEAAQSEALQRQNRMLLAENESLASQMSGARSKIEELEGKYAEHVQALSAGLEDAVSMARARTGEWQESEALRAAFVAVEAVQASLQQKEEQEQRDREAVISEELMERTRQAEAEAAQSEALQRQSMLLVKEQQEREAALSEKLMVCKRQAEAEAAQSEVYVTAVQAVHETLQRERNVLTSEVDSLFAEVAMGVRKADDLRSALIEVRLDRNQLVDQLNSMKSEMEEYRASAAEELILQRTRMAEVQELLIVERELSREQKEELDRLKENFNFVQAEGHQIRQQLCQKESALANEQERVRDLQAEINSLQVNLNSSQAESRMSLQELGAMSDLFEQKDSQANELRQSRSTLQAEIVVIRDELCTSRQEREKQEHELSAERDANACLQSEMDTLRKTHAEVSKYVLQLRTEYAQQQAGARRLEMELKALQESSQTEIAMLRLDVDTAHMSEADMAVRAAHADAKNVELQRELDGMRRQSHCMQTELHQLRERARQEHERTASVQIGLQKLSAEVGSVLVGLETLRHELAHCEVQLAVKNRATQDLGSELESLSAGYSNALEVARSTSDELLILQDEKQHLSQQNIALSAQLETGAQGMRVLQSDILALRHEKDRLRDQVFVLEARIAGNVEERNNLQSQMEMLRHELQQSTVKSTEDSVRLLNQQHEIRQLKHDKQTIAADLGLMETQLECMKQHVQQANTDAADMASKLTEAKTESRRLSQEIATLSADARMLSKQNATSQQMLVKVRGERMSLINYVDHQCLEVQSIEREVLVLKQSLEHESDDCAQKLRQLAQAKVAVESTLVTQVDETQRHCAALKVSLETVQLEKKQAMQEVSLRDSRIAQLSSALSKAESSLLSSQLHTEQLSKQLASSHVQIASEEHFADEALKVARSSEDEAQQLVQQRELLILESKQAQTQKKFLEEELDAVQQQYASLQREMAHLAANAFECQERLEVARKETTKMQDEQRHLQQGAELLELEKEATRKQVIALEKDVSDYQKRLQIASSGMLELQEERQQLQQGNELLAVEKESMRKQVSALEKNVHALETDITEYQERMREARAETAAVRLEQQKVQEKHGALESENEANKLSLRQNNDQLVQLRAEKSKILLEQRQQQHEKDALALQIEANREQMQKMEQDLVQARAEIGKILAEKEQLREEQDALALQNGLSREQMRTMEQDLSAQTAKVEVLQVELSQSKMDLSEARLIASTSQSDLRDLRARNDELVQAKHGLEREIVSTKMERDLLVQELGVSTSDVSGSNPFAHITDENTQPPNAALLAAGPRMKILSSQIAQQKAVARTEREKYSQMQAHLSEIHLKLEVSQNELRATKYDLSTLKTEKDTLVKETSVTERQIHDLSSQLTTTNTELAATLNAQEQMLALHPSIERLEDMLESSVRSLQHWQQDVERLKQRDRISALSLSEANTQYQLLEDDYLELQAKYYDMESRFEDSQVRLEILHNGVTEMSASHANQETALRLMPERITLRTRALSKWRAVLHHKKVSRRIAVRRAQKKRLNAAAFVWRAWKMFYLQRAKMIERKDYWREKGSMAEIIRRQSLQRIVRMCFEQFKAVRKGKKLLSEAAHFLKYVCERKLRRQLLQRWRAHVFCQNYVGYVPRPSRLSKFQIFQSADLRMAMMLSKEVSQRVAAYSRARRNRELSFVLQSWAVVNKASRVESAVTQRVVARFGENQGRWCVKRALVYWARLCFSSGLDGGCLEPMIWAKVVAKLLRRQEAGSRLLLAFSLTGRCKCLKESLAGHALRYDFERLVSDTFMGWSLVAKASSRELAMAEQTADHLSVKARMLHLESANALLESEVEQRGQHLCLWEHRHEAAAELSLRIGTRQSDYELIFTCFMALRSVSRWRARTAAVLQRSCNERVLYMLSDILQQWLRVAVSSQVRTCAESLEMERSSVNTLAQWHAAARHEQEAWRSLVHRIAVELSQLSQDCQQEFTGLPLAFSQLTVDHQSEVTNYREQVTRVRFRLDARSVLLERWLETRHAKRAIHLGLIAWTQIWRQSQQAKRTVVLQRSFHQWRQVRFGQQKRRVPVPTHSHVIACKHISTCLSTYTSTQACTRVHKCTHDTYDICRMYGQIVRACRRLAWELDASLNDQDASDEDADALQDHLTLNAKQVFFVINVPRTEPPHNLTRTYNPPHAHPCPFTPVPQRGLVDLLLQAAELQKPREGTPRAAGGERDRGSRRGRENGSIAGGARDMDSPFAAFANTAIGRLEELGHSMRD